MLDYSSTAPIDTDVRDHLVSVDAHNIHVVENGAHDGAALLLIHGHAGSTTWWDLLIPRLAVEYRVIRVDLLGHGRSDKPAGCCTMSEQARVVGSALAQLGVNRVIAIGHATGAVVAAALAEQRRGIVTALALIDIARVDDSDVGNFRGRRQGVAILLDRRVQRRSEPCRRVVTRCRPPPDARRPRPDRPAVDEFHRKK